MKNLLFILMFSMSLSANAGQIETVTRSAGKLINDSSVSLSQKRAQSRIIRNFTDHSKQRQARTAKHDSSISFTIFDAWVELSGDKDGDGYFHQIKTSFDADVDTAQETVYAKIYLSHSGGSWVQIAETDLFEIRYDSMSDSYEVETELLEGFPGGRYDVLVELYSFYHPGIVASVVLYQDIDGYVISLEDKEHDRSGYSMSAPTYTTEGSGYLVTEEEYIAGSLSWPGLLLFGCLLAIKLRYFPSRSTTL